MVSHGLTGWGVKEAADKLNVNAYQTGPATPDPAQQVKVIEDLIAKNVNAIIVVPNDATVLEPVLKKPGIKVLLCCLMSPLISR
jgi:simple sugar transport system substrate-binding protein